jgi:DNA mismatch repair protein MSH3
LTKSSSQAVQANTADVFYDSLTDDLLRAVLEALLLKLPPSELILPATPLSSPSERMLEVLAKKSDIRVERVADENFTRASAAARLGKFYGGKSSKPETSRMLDQMGEGPTICLAAMLDHLSKFRLDSILRATTAFAPARLQFRMSLPVATLTNLELFAVAGSGQEKGSLFSIINRTRTQFGRRLLRKWLAAPLTSREEIIARQDAVEGARSLFFYNKL